MDQIAFRRFAAVAAALAVVSVAACSDDDPVAPPDPIELTFVKTGGPEVWTGTVSGDVQGALTTELQEAEPSEEDENVLEVRFLWIIAAGADSFTADLSGTLNLATGVAKMEGDVVQASDQGLVGAHVEEEGQLVDVDPETDETTFQGTITVFP